jgi:hypothetical protein
MMPGPDCREDGQMCPNAQTFFIFRTTYVHYVPIKNVSCFADKPLYCVTKYTVSFVKANLNSITHLFIIPHNRLKPVS